MKFIEMLRYWALINNACARALVSITVIFIVYYVFYLTESQVPLFYEWMLKIVFIGWIASPLIELFKRE